MRSTMVKKVAVACAALALSLGLAEAISRVVYTPDPERRVYDPFAYRIPAPGLSESFVNQDGERVQIHLNELGMRGPSVAAPVARDGLTVVFLGGSTTENYAYNDIDTFPVEVGAEIQRTLQRPVRILNAGMSAATSSVNLARLQHQILDLRPDVVVVMDGINDLLDGFRTGYRRDGRHLERPAAAGHRPKSYLWDWLRRLWLARSARARGSDLADPRRDKHVTDYQHFPAREVFARNMRSMAAILEAQAVDVLFVTMATMYSDAPDPRDRARFSMRAALADRERAYPDVPSLAAGMRAFNAVVDALPRGSRVHVFDLGARMPQTWQAFYDDCHFTKAGNRLVAAALAPEIERILRTAAGATPR